MRQLAHHAQAVFARERVDDGAETLEVVARGYTFRNGSKLVGVARGANVPAAPHGRGPGPRGGSSGGGGGGGF